MANHDWLRQRTYTTSAEELALLDPTERLGETIVALSSGSGRSGVAVIRISGPKAGQLRQFPGLYKLFQHVHRRLYAFTTRPEGYSNVLVYWNVSLFMPEAMSLVIYGDADDAFGALLKPGSHLPKPRYAVSTYLQKSQGNV